MNIHTLKLHTATDLAILQQFYAQLLEQPQLQAHNDQLSMQIGTSQLIFEYVKNDQAIRYHFAINIPENQFEQAWAWLRQKVELASENNGETRFFSENWNANMVYFYDPAGNILELIARHTLDQCSNQPFSATSLLAISEIGIATNDPPVLVEQIQQQLDLKLYHPTNSTTFMPLGDEHGLFIIVKQGRIWFPDTGIPAELLPVTVLVEHNQRQIELHF